MKKYIFLTLALIFCSINIFGQDHWGSDSMTSRQDNRNTVKSVRDVTVVKEKQKIVVKTDTTDNTFSTMEKVKRTKDYVLYRDVVRRYTWLTGVGEPITQEVADKLQYYYRLSMKNEAGNYQMVEAMHGRELTTEHPLSPYILNKKNDSDLPNSIWLGRLKTIGQWHFYADLSGEKVVEERAYEAVRENAQLVYAMQVIQNDSTHVTISYSNSWGLPADMNENKENTYGSVVSITYDDNGHDYIVDYLDGQGYRKQNTDGVDQKRYFYDDKGRVTLATSNNCVGDYAIDNWGNCAVRYSYDDKNNILSVTILDKELKPMRMPHGRSDLDATYIRCDSYMDKWGRVTEKVMLTETGEKDSTLSGIHKISYIYSDKGDIEKTMHYDINGNIIER